MTKGEHGSNSHCTAIAADWSTVPHHVLAGCARPPTGSGIHLALRKRFIRPRLPFKWSQDVMRHSFASYHLALHRNEASTCYEMGDNSTTLFKHYRKLVTPEQAAEFFGIKLPR